MLVSNPLNSYQANKFKRFANLLSSKIALYSALKVPFLASIKGLESVYNQTIYNSLLDSVN